MKGFLIWDNESGKFFFRERDGDNTNTDYELRVDDLPIEVELGNYYSVFEEDGRKYIGYKNNVKEKLFNIYRKSSDGVWHKTNWGGDDLTVVLNRAKEIARGWEEKDYNSGKVGIKLLDSILHHELFVWERNG